MTAFRRLPTIALALLALVGGLLARPAQALDPDKAFHHYVRNAWSIQAGLPQISVQAIAQDKLGYIWVGTQSGLARFDGIRFTTYKPESEPALPGIWIRTLLVDPQGRLWIGTYKGLAVYENGRFRAIPAADPVKFPVLDVFALIQAPDGSIIAGTSNGVFDLKAGRLVVRAGSPAPAQSLLLRDDGLWVGTLAGVHRIEGPSTSYFLPLPPEAAKAAVTRLVSAQGRSWAGTSLGLYLRTASGWRQATDHPKVKNSPVTTLFEDSDHNLWVGTNAGLSRYRGGILVEFVPDTSPGAFKGVISAYEDHEHNLWLGSQWEGLARVWNGWTRRISASEGLLEPIVWSIARAPDGRTWVGTNDGLGVFDGTSYTQVLRGDELPHPHAYNLLAEADRVWIGTRRGLVILRDGKLEAPPLFAPMAALQINGIYPDSRGDYWFPTSDGLFRLHEGQLRRYGQDEGLGNVRTRLVRELRDGRLLLATQSGLYELRGDRLVPMGLDSGLHQDMDITAVYELAGGELAIGTLAEETYVFDGKRWHTLGVEQGMPANAPFFIFEDGAGWLWVSGIRGITRVPVAQVRELIAGTRRTVTAEMVLNERGDRLSGQQGFCCNGAGNAKGFADGPVLWLPSRNGVVTLDTRAIVRNLRPPTVVIERVQSQGQWRPIGTPGMRELPATARDVGFEFTALSFQDPASVLLQYRLVGYDADWRNLELVSPRAANYTNLPSGKYTFEVRGANNSGVWNPGIAHFAFRIKPYFHETPLFFALVALLLGAMLYAAWRYQRRAHEAQRALLEQQVRERTQQLHAANLQLEYASQTDPLTGLRNRRYLANQIPADLSFYDREQARGAHSGQSLLFALVDIDHFKQVNDTYGHRAGDHVLQQFAEVLTRLVRTGDYIVRWGGEEFLLVFRPMPRQYVAAMGDRIRRAVKEHRFEVSAETPIALTCSIGLAEYPIARDARHQLGWEQMVELADAALYWVKRNGRDGWATLVPTEHANLAALVRGLQGGAETLVESRLLNVVSSRDAAHDRAPAGG
jgi:diguanylate cyclase (GGDEF)-like protein